MLRLSRGARILTSSALTKGSDVLNGTQLLLTAAGRETLKDCFKRDYESGADAVMTSLDTSFDHLDAGGFFADYERSNDLSYYVLGKGNGEGKFELQGNGQKFLIPRGAGVSVGEMRDFAMMLCNMTSLAALQAREELAAPSSAQLGATIQFSAREDGTNLADGSLHLGNRMEAQITSAGMARPDFFAIEGCSTARDVGLVAEVLGKHTLREEKGHVVDWRGFDVFDDELSTVGFDIPALLLLRAGGGDLKELAVAVAKSAHIGGIGVIDRVLSEAELDELHAQLGKGAILAGRTADKQPEGELSVLRA